MGCLRDGVHALRTTQPSRPAGSVRAAERLSCSPDADIRGSELLVHRVSSRRLRSGWNDDQWRPRVTYEKVAGAAEHDALDRTPVTRAADEHVDVIAEPDQFIAGQTDE